MKKSAIIYIGVLVIIIFLAVFFFSTYQYSITGNSQTEFNTQVSCSTDSYCLNMESMPENVYCKESTCRFMQSAIDEKISRFGQ